MPSIWTLGKISLLSSRYLYPLSDSASTSHCRITSPDFRPCSTCQSHSQAPLCTYTRHLIANQVEGTLGASVTFWEATAPVKLPTRHCP